MTKLITPLLILSLLAGCTEPDGQEREIKVRSHEAFFSSYEIVKIDSCEYLELVTGDRYALTHKGNCKYCEQRKQKH